MNFLGISFGKKEEATEIKTEVKSLTERKIVTESNALIEAKYSLTLAEQKLILLAIAQVDSINDNKFFTYRITIPELEKRLGVEIKQSQLKETCKRLMQRVVYVENPQNPKDWDMLHWVETAKYRSGMNTIEFKISDEMRRHMLHLQKFYAGYELENALRLNSIYSIRFYKLLMEVKNQVEHKIELGLNYLYELLQLPKTMRLIGQFKRDVLEPAKKEINLQTDITMNYKLIKTGHKYTDIILSYINKNDPNAKIKTSPARAAATQKYNNKKFAKYAGKEFAITDLYAHNQIKFYICKKFDTAPEINKQRGDGNYSANVGDGSIFFNSVEEFENAIKLAKKNQHLKLENERQIKKNKAKAEAMINSIIKS